MAFDQGDESQFRRQIGSRHLPLNSLELLVPRTQNALHFVSVPSLVEAGPAAHLPYEIGGNVVGRNPKVGG